VSASYRCVVSNVGADVARLAAVGDLHVTARMRGLLRACFERVHEEADVLLLAGDLTNGGRVDEAHVLTGELAEVGVTVVAVLGNHDHDEDNGHQITAMLQEAGVVVLEGGGVVLDVREISLGIAGVTGFDGGFAVTSQDFSDPHSHAERHQARSAATELHQALKRLDTMLRVALTHYAVVPDTLVGEPAELYRYLGSDLLGQAIDAAGADLAIHGHAHFGTERGSTPAGVPVRNVARPVLNRPYAIYPLRRPIKS
jgi:Icc-related predicted phosphoesterase